MLSLANLFTTCGLVWTTSLMSSAMPAPTLRRRNLLFLVLDLYSPWRPSRKPCPIFSLANWSPFESGKTTELDADCPTAICCAGNCYLPTSYHRPSMFFTNPPTFRTDVMIFETMRDFLYLVSASRYLSNSSCIILRYFLFPLCSCDFWRNNIYGIRVEELET